NIAYSSWAFAGTYAVSGPSDAPAAPTDFAAANEGFGVRLTWTESTSYDVVRYEIRTGASWESGTPIGAVMANTFFYQPQTAGSTTYWLSAIDAWGNALTAVSAGATASVPAVGGLALTVDGDSALIVWTAPSASYEVSDYEIRLGSSYGSSNLLGY